MQIIATTGNYTMADAVTCTQIGVLSFGEWDIHITDVRQNNWPIYTQQAFPKMLWLSCDP